MEKKKYNLSSAKSEGLVAPIQLKLSKDNDFLFTGHGGHGGRVVTLAPPTSEAGVRFPA